MKVYVVQRNYLGGVELYYATNDKKDAIEKINDFIEYNPTAVSFFTVTEFSTVTNVRISYEYNKETKELENECFVF